VLALTAALRRDGRIAEAEALLASSVGGGSGDLWFRWGIQLSTLARYDEAISAYDEAVRRGPGPGSPWSRGSLLRSEALLFRGLAHRQAGRTGEAEADLRRAMAAAPQDPRIHYSLGRLAVQSGEDGAAWDHFTTALTVEPAYVPAHLGLALLREQHGRPAEAVAHYQAAMRLDPSSRTARVRLAAVLLAAGRRDEAEMLLGPEAEESHWGSMAAFHYGLTRLRANDPARALEVWERLRGGGAGERSRGGELREWTALAHDREARNLLAADPTAARLQWQLALVDAPDVEGRRTALREASLREAAWLVLTGRDLPDSRNRAAASLDIAESLPGPDDGGLRQDRLRAILGLVGGATNGIDKLLDASERPRDRGHLATAALLAGRAEQAAALLAEPDPESGGDPAVARLRALVAEDAGNWSDAVVWHQRFLTNEVRAVSGGPGGTGVPREPEPAPDTEANTLILDLHAIVRAQPSGALHDVGMVGTAHGAHTSPCTAAVGVACTELANGACGGCGREGCLTHLYRPVETSSFRCERCAGAALQAVLYAARRAGIPDRAERTLTSWADALDGTPTARIISRQLALLRAEAGDLDGALARLPAEDVDDRVGLLIRRAGDAIDRGDPYGAIGDLRQVLRLQPGQPQAVAVLEKLAEHEATDTSR
jgi:tetratricopeptide (TPR) repeat protein